MSLPRYIVNFEEMLNFLIPNDDNGENNGNVEMGHQRSKGLKLEIGEKANYETFWRPLTDILITGIRIAVSDETIHARDSLDMYIDGEPVFKNVSLKNIYQYKNFRVFRRVRQSLDIKFVYNNMNRVSKDVWIDIDYIGESLLAPVIVKCINTSNNQEIKNETYEMSLGFHTFFAPNIDGYRLENETEYYQKLLLEESNLSEPTEIIFNYKRKRL